MTRWACVALALFGLGCSRDLTLPPPVPSSIAGRVVAEQAGTGQTGPAVGARIEFVGTGIATTADPQTGRFRFDRLPPPPRQLWIQWSSTGTTTFDRQRVLSGGIVDQSGPVELGDIDVAQNAEVHGRVLLADNPSDTQAQAGTVVFVQHYPYTALAVPGGGFFMPQLPAGTLSIGFFRTGYAPASVDAVQLTSGGSLSLLDVTLTPLADGGTQAPGALKGTVVGPDGSAASGALVVASASVVAGTASQVNTASDGTFLLPNVPAGPYSVAVSSSSLGAHALVGGVLVPAGQTTDLGTLTLSTAAITTTPPPTTPPLPFAIPGADQIVIPSSAVILDGTASTGAELTYHWMQTGGTSVTISPNDSPQAAHASFVAPSAAQTLSFQLVVQDSFGQRSAAASTQIFVNAPPVPSLVASPPAAPTNVTVTLDASGTTDADPADSLSYSFIQTEGPTVTLTPTGNPARVTFTPSQQGIYGFQVLVNDGHTRVLSSALQVVISQVNHPPVPRVTVGNSSHPGSAPIPGDVLVLDASGSSDPDGNTLSFRWSVPDGGAALSCTACASATLTTPVTSGTYRYPLVVTDNGSPPLSATATAVFQVNTAVIATSPLDGDIGVSPLGPVSVTFNGLLDATSASGTPLVVSTSDAGVSGHVSYASVAGHGVITWTPDISMPASTPIRISVPVYTDSSNNPTQPASFGFTTRPLAWVDRSPMDPRRNDPLSDAGVDYSYYPIGPALASAASGAFLASTEWGPGMGSNGAFVLRRWSSSALQWTPYDQIVNTNSAPIPYVYQANNTTGAGAYLYRATERSYVGVDIAGQPVAAFDYSNNGQLYYYSYAAGSSAIRALLMQTVSAGASFASDGVNDWMAAPYCYQYSQIPAYTVNRVGDTNQGNTPALTWGYPGSGCAGLSMPELGTPALAGHNGVLYLAAAYQTSASTPYVVNLMARPSNNTTTFDPAGVLDGGSLGLTAGGILNGAQVTGFTQVQMAMSARGPVLAFLEFPGGSSAVAQIRTMLYDESRRTFVDPLGSSAVSSLVQPTLPDGTTYSAIDDPVIAVVNEVPYVAFIARKGATGLQRVYVAHADAARHAWVLDADNANGDGALNLTPSCNPTTLSIAAIDGRPAVSWGESCAIPGQPQSPSPFSIHSQNLLAVKRLE